MNYEGNASYLYVGNITRGTDTIAGMANGSVGLVNEAGTILTGATTTGKARVVQRLANGQLVYSPFFDMSTLLNKNGASYVAPVQQISYLGYNTTSGSLTVAAGEDYVVNIEWKNTAGFYNNKPLLLTGMWHTTAASQEELAVGLLASLDGALNRQAFTFVKTEKVSNGTFADWTGAAAAMSVINGSKAVIYTDGSAAAALGEALADGTYVFIAGATYVVSGAGTTSGFTLDTPYKGATAEVTGGTTYASQCGLATTITNWGIRFTGVESSDFDAMVDSYSVTRFGLITGDFPASDITYVTDPSEGQGYYKTVANIEAYAQFLDKASMISAYPRNNVRSEVSSTYQYDICSFDVKELVSTSVGTGLSYSKSFRISIATDDGLAGDDVDTVLGVTV